MTIQQLESYILVTGANTGLGFAICCRIIDEFLQTRPASHKLILIPTTRNEQKGADTVLRLRKHFSNFFGASKTGVKIGDDAQATERRVQVQPEVLELTSLSSVRTLSEKLHSSIPKLDAIILNAGIGGFTGINWGLAIWQSLTDFHGAMTWPTFKIGATGLLTDPQLPWNKTDSILRDSNEQEKNWSGKTPPLGAVFCSNVFGHYLLAHYLTPLLSAQELNSGNRGRVIWISSIEALAVTLDPKDIQCLKTDVAYEASKRLTDILALTSELPSTRPWVDSFLAPPEINTGVERHSLPTTSRIGLNKPKFYVAHPGIASTDIIALPIILAYLKLLAFYLARLFGNPWHTITPYTGACAPVWLALSPQSQLDELEECEGPGKWGSASDMWGRARVVRTEVEGWGFGGRVGEKFGKMKGRRPGVNELTRESREEFEALGREVWREMEQLRQDWEKRLG